MKCFRLFNGELKKIFSGIMMYFLAGIFILALTILPHFFKPTKQYNYIDEISLNTSTVATIHDSFLELKTESDNGLELTKTKLNNLINTPQKRVDELLALKNNLKNSRHEFQRAVHFLVENDTTLINDCYNAKEEMYNNIVEIENLYSKYMNRAGENSTIAPVILVDDTLDYNIRTELTSFKMTLGYDGSNAPVQPEGQIVTYYNEMNLAITRFKYLDRLEMFLNQIKELPFTSERISKIITDYATYKNTEKEAFLTIVNDLYGNVEDLNGVENKSEENKQKAKNAALNYLSINHNLNIIIENSAYLEATSSLSNEKLSKFIGYENYNSYKLNEEKTKSQYYLDNNMLDNELASMYSFNTISKNETNAFDYMYFAMEVMSILIVAFAVIIGAGMIAKEHNNGTIKLLAIRPYKRSKIMFSKIMATLFFTFIFLLLSAVVSLITGYIMFGISFTNMLVIVNAQTAFALPNWVVFLIYLGSLMLKVWFYVLLAITISTVLKSYIASVCISTGLYFSNLIITFVANGESFLKYNLFANIDLFKYFGGSFNSISSSNPITKLFTSPVFPDANIIVPLVVLGASILIFNIITFSVFNKRDIT